LSDTSDAFSVIIPCLWGYLDKSKVISQLAHPIAGFLRKKPSRGLRNCARAQY